MGIRHVLFLYYYSFYSLDIYINRLISKCISYGWKSFRKSEKSYLDLYENANNGLSSIYAGGVFIGAIYIIFVSVFNFLLFVFGVKLQSFFIYYIIIFIAVYLIIEMLVFADERFSDWLKRNSSSLKKNKTFIYLTSFFFTGVILYTFFASLNYLTN